MDRRAFVRGCVYASAAGMMAATAAGLAGPLAPGGSARWRRVDYLGATVVGGPAPQGLPLLPLARDAEGRLRADPTPASVEGGVLDWYRYCGHERMPQLQQKFAARDELLRYELAPERAEQALELRGATGRRDVAWQLGKLGLPARAEDFAGPGYGASVVWRGAVRAIVLALRREDVVLEGGAAAGAEGFFVEGPADTLLVAYVGFCRHLCCIPGWHESRKALGEGLFDQIYCTCHYSVFDPRRVRPDFFMLRET
ncbi:MAG TPA: hypothetical protein VGR28_07930 [Candidatus Thermoplasmatota archaeon]|jgi:Rieske Fe-S protein|nr:hypothetical protein [Candidatus Thermoplasmatota archaeon]